MCLYIELWPRVFILYYSHVSAYCIMATCLYLALWPRVQVPSTQCEQVPKQSCVTVDREVCQVAIWCHVSRVTCHVSRVMTTCAGGAAAGVPAGAEAAVQ